MSTNRDEIQRGQQLLALGSRVKATDLHSGHVILGVGTVESATINGAVVRLRIAGSTAPLSLGIAGSVTVEGASLDMDARYSVDGYEGIAFYLRGYVMHRPECQGHPTDDYAGNYPDAAIGDVAYCDGTCEEETEDYERVRAVMVGDDREHVIEVADLTLLPDGAWCGQCGQIGCEHDGQERPEEAADMSSGDGLGA